jgi:hypothetical protein
VEGNEEGMEEARRDTAAKNERNQNLMALANKNVPLDQYLLFLVFSKMAKREVRDLAVQVLIQNFNQRSLLLAEVVKVELLISDHDIIEYREIQA